MISNEALIGIAIACFGILFVGGLVVGLGTLGSFALLLLNIWSHIKPKTDNLAPLEYVKSVDERSNNRFTENRNAIDRNHEHSERRFSEVMELVSAVGRSVSSLSEPVNRLIGEFEANRRNQQK